MFYNNCLEKQLIMKTITSKTPPKAQIKKISRFKKKKSLINQHISKIILTISLEQWGRHTQHTKIISKKY